MFIWGYVFFSTILFVALHKKNIFAFLPARIIVPPNIFSGQRCLATTENDKMFYQPSLPPIKTMREYKLSRKQYATFANKSSIVYFDKVFIDGSWLYFSFLHGRGTTCPIIEKYGKNWSSRYHVDWRNLVHIIETNLYKQISAATKYSRPLDVVRTYVFTSSKEFNSNHENSDKVITPRYKMISELQDLNFEVQVFSANDMDEQEKCVDIALAVEMLYMATVPDSYDIAVVITGEDNASAACLPLHHTTEYYVDYIRPYIDPYFAFYLEQGDKDFMPAMYKTRQKAKRVALCSMRNSCNSDLVSNGQQVRDFDIVWLDDHLDELIVEGESTKSCKLTRSILYSLTILERFHNIPQLHLCLHTVHFIIIGENKESLMFEEIRARIVKVRSSEEQLMLCAVTSP